MPVVNEQSSSHRGLPDHRCDGLACEFWKVAFYHPTVGDMKRSDLLRPVLYVDQGGTMTLKQWRTLKDKVEAWFAEPGVSDWIEEYNLSENRNARHEEEERRFRELNDSRRATLEKEKAGFVYIGQISGMVPDLITKIGTSKTVSGRINDHIKTYGDSWKTVAIRPSPDPLRIEKKIRTAFKRKALTVGKDFFSLSPEELGAAVRMLEELTA